MCNNYKYVLNEIYNTSIFIIINYGNFAAIKR